MSDPNSNYNSRIGLYRILQALFVVAVGWGLTIVPAVGQVKVPTKAKTPDSKAAITQNGPVAKPDQTQKEFRETNPIYLDDLTEKKFEVGFGTLGKHGATGYPQPHVQRLRIGDSEAKHALSIVPLEKGAGFVEYAVERRYNAFRATAALNSPTVQDGLTAARRDKWNGSAEAPMIFRVLGDNKLLWESKPLKRHGTSEACEVSIEGVDVLRLEVKSDSRIFAWSFWGEPLVLRREAVASTATPAALEVVASAPLKAGESNQVYLDDLPEGKFEVGHGKLGKHGSTGFPAEQIQRFRVRDTEVKHSLNMHPEGNKTSFVTYSLAKKFQVLRGTAALNTPTEKDGLANAKSLSWKGTAVAPLKFRVVGDGKVLWESKPLQKHGDFEDCEVEIDGVDQLRLECQCLGPANFAWAFWGDPRVLQREAPVPTVQDETLFTFNTLTLPEPVTGMAMTEDGQFIVASHAAANMLSVWDVLQEKLLKTIETPTPRTVLCRGDHVFVVNQGHGTISQFSREKNWELQNNFDIGKKNIVHISAPHAEFFNGELLASCHGEGAEGSYRGASIVWLDTKPNRGTNAQIKVIEQTSGVATFSFDGKLVLGHGTFHLSPGGGIAGFAYPEFLTSRDRKVFSGSLENYVNQDHPGSYWYGSDVVMAGAPSMTRVARSMGHLVIPDLSQRVLYAIHQTQLSAHRLDTSLTEIGRRKTVWPGHDAAPASTLAYGGRHRGYLMDEPAAFTRDGRLYIYVLNTVQNTIYSARAKAISEPGELGVRMVASSIKSSTLVASGVKPDGIPAAKTAVATPAAKSTNSTLIQLEEVTLNEPPTEMAMSEDGLFLIVSHQAGNMISIWDVLNHKLVKMCETPTPRSILCRGDNVFVANHGAGTISMFSREKNWELVNQFDTDQKNVVHISAPHREHFKGELLVSCHGEGVEGSYRGNKIVHIDTKTDKHRVVPASEGSGMGSAIATYSYDGKIVVGQGSFNLSPGGAIYGYPAADFLKGKARAVFSSGVDSRQYLNQEHTGSFWYGANTIISAGPQSAKMSQDMGSLIIPDFSQRVLYALHSDRLTAHRLDSKLTELGDRKIEWPEGDKTVFDGIGRYGGRHRAYLLDEPAAFTRAGQLRLFLLDSKKQRVFIARTPAIVKGGAGGVELASASATSATPAADKPAKEPDVPAATDEFGLPAQIVEGSKLDVKLKGPEGAEYELLNGPEGMQLTKAGQITWASTANHTGAHVLKIRIKSGSKVNIVRPKFEVVDKELVASNGGRVEGADQGERLALELDHMEFTPSKDYASLLLLQGDHLRVLGSNGLAVSGDHKLPKRYRQIADRGDDFIALANEPNELDIINRKTLKVRKSIKLEASGVRIMETMDMVPHPFRVVTYITIKNDIQVPRYRVLIVNESSGKVEAPPDMIGTWLRIDPAGRNLYAGYEDIFKKGSEFFINPGNRVVEATKYGHIDWLVTYDLRGSKPKIADLIRDAGGNGSGIVLSADGKRITYLSHVGTPLHSGNLVAWNPLKLGDPAVSYELKGKVGSPNQLAFHPTLPIAAVPGSGSAVLFHREKGTELKDKLQLTSAGLGEAKVERALFSPDGTALVFVCNDTSGRYLRRVGLRLTKDELAIAARGVSKSEEITLQLVEPKKNLLKVNESEIDGLKSSEKPAPMTPKEISRRYANSVVVIKSEDGSGTGFVIGKQGIILTCAHVIPETGEVTVTYNLTDGNKTKSRTSKAKVIRIEPARDLALLKIESPALVSVILGPEDGTEAGEDVTVIGNPGLGDEILAQTITTGIVSSTKRVMEDQEYIQTSAVVNPGNSGGPMFDSQGLVIGLVVRKATVNEATAFAVPAKNLRKFLLEATISNK